MTERGEEKFTAADTIVSLAVVAAILVKEGWNKFTTRASKITAPSILKHNHPQDCLSKPLHWLRKP